ncbi:chaperone protein DNAj, putative, partial [Ixodes scapularis]
PCASAAMTKSLLLTYVLWLTGGWFGAHHFYLGRDRHAFVWWMTLGGYFGIGWLRDLWRIPEYVKLANRDPAATEQLKEKIQRNAKPVSSTARSVGQMVVSDALGYMVLYALPLDVIPESLLPLAAIPVPLAVAVGKPATFWWVSFGGCLWRVVRNLFSAFRVRPTLVIRFPLPVFWSSLASSYMFNHHSKRWRLVPRPQRSLRWRLLVLAACCLLYGSLWASWLYFNCSVTDSDGTQVKCRHSLRHFFGSPLWRDFKNVAHELYTHLRHHGWRELWRLLVDALDPQGEASALKVLGLPASATQEEITNAYRKLSRRWHPDRFHEPLQKQEAQETFIEIQKAYETLSSLKSRRLKKNIVERENPNAPRVEF